MNYTVFAAMKEDLNNGWVWVARPQVTQRSVVSVRNRENGRTVYCEALAIDDNFVRSYNKDGRYIADPDNAIVLSEWYRNRLGGLKTQAEYDLSVAGAEHLVGRVRACVDHPQVVVRLATWLGLWSVVLSVVAILLALI